MSLQRFIVLFLLTKSSISTKIWSPTTDFGDSAHWRFPPKNCSSLIFGENNGIAVNMYTGPNNLLHSLMIDNIIFAMPQVSLIFDEGAQIQFASIGSCLEKKKAESWFSAGKDKYWLDPQNWKDASIADKRSWKPHRDRVPCAGEDVVFPAKQTFSVELPQFLVPAGTFTVENASLDTNKWAEYLQSPEGYQTFSGPADLRATLWRTDTGCNKKKTCVCSRGAYFIEYWWYRDIDAFARDAGICVLASRRCPSSEATLCNNPIYPEGHCCGVCGAIVTIEDNSEDGIDVVYVSKLVNNSIASASPNLKYYVGRKLDGNIEISVIAEDGNTWDAIDFARTISTEIRSTEANIKVSDLGSISMDYSGGSKNQNPLKRTMGIMFGTLLAVIFVMLSIYYIYMVLPKKSWNPFPSRDPFTFVRFKSNLVEAASEATLVLETEHPPPDQFSNPLYEAGTTVESPKEPDPKADSTDSVQQLLELDDLQTTNDQQLSDISFIPEAEEKEH